MKKKPRTYRHQARKDFLGFGILRRSTSCVHAVVGLVKQRRPKKHVLRRAIKHQLQYVRRNLGHIERLMARWSIGSRLLAYQ